MEFTKRHTEITKGVAILLMFIHHLFNFPDRIGKSNAWISLASINGQKIEYILGGFGGICVSIFLFLSGYGIYISNTKKANLSFKDTINRVKKIYINYWIVFIIFIPIGFIFFERAIDLKEFVLNIFAIETTYNEEWWFLRIYIELIIVLPILEKIINRNFIKGIFGILGLLLLSKIINKIFITSAILKYFTTNIIYKDLILLLFWQAPFSMGYLFAKFNIFTVVMNRLKVLRLNNNLIYFFLAIGVIIFRSKLRNTAIIDFILVPIFIFSVVNIIYKSIFNCLFSAMGKNSINMWLTHSFFCYAYWQNVIFKPKVSIFILIWLIILTMMCSYIINKILYIYSKRFSSSNQRQVEVFRKQGRKIPW